MDRRSALKDHLVQLITVMQRGWGQKCHPSAPSHHVKKDWGTRTFYCAKIQRSYYHPQSSVVIAFAVASVCRCLYFFVIRSIGPAGLTFERLDVGSSFPVCGYIFKGNTGQGLIGKSSGQGQGHSSKRRQISYSRDVKLRSAIFPVL